MRRGGDRRQVAVIAVPDVVVLDLAIPVDVFGSDPNYDVLVCSAAPQVTTAVAGLACRTINGLEAAAGADLVVVPGHGSFEQAPPESVVSAVRRAHDHGARLLSICTGAFTLAAAGLLAGRPATTHWRAASLLKSRYPDIDVRPDRLFVDDGDVLTSAGVTSGIDLCLHVVRKDFGAATANERARDLVAPPVREGGQAQYTKQFRPEATAGTLADIREWMLANLHHRHTLDELAHRAGCSRRTFIRRFRDETGTSAHTWLTAARIDLARELLETTLLPVDRIGYRVGLGSPANIRAVFHRHVGISPAKYRSTFNPASRVNP
ncbi:GlxA family transcriptional regulator [Nocardia sp. N2S4-5]|uniref:GlxA family transcriptional regulator n=1 Tax=Nocardia sp. N2S4-5 TaxID=3351565 RepID=UPI0037D4F827